MGKDSTLTVSRKAAMWAVWKLLFNARRSELENALYALWGDDNCYNFIVVEDEEAEDDHRLESVR